MCVYIYINTYPYIRTYANSPQYVATSERAERIVTTLVYESRTKKLYTHTHTLILYLAYIHMCTHTYTCVHTLQYVATIERAQRILTNSSINRAQKNRIYIYIYIYIHTYVYTHIRTYGQMDTYCSAWQPLKELSASSRH